MPIMITINIAPEAKRLVDDLDRSKESRDHYRAGAGKDPRLPEPAPS